MAISDRVHTLRGRHAFRVATIGVLLALLAVPASAQEAAGEAAAPPIDPNGTRLFFGPTGRSLPQGKGYAGVYGLFLPFVQVGVTDRVSVGGGMPLLFPASAGVFWITPKVQVFRGDRIQAAAGLVHIATVGSDGAHMGVAYGVTTIGSADRAVTIGAGWGYEREAGGRSDGVLVLVGAERRMSRRTKLITENYLSTGSPILSAGVRLYGERFSADLALMAFASRQDTLVFPMVTVACSFGGEH